MADILTRKPMPTPSIDRPIDADDQASKIPPGDILTPFGIIPDMSPKTDMPQTSTQTPIAVPPPQTQKVDPAMLAAAGIAPTQTAQPTKPQYAVSSTHASSKSVTPALYNQTEAKALQDAVDAQKIAQEQIKEKSLSATDALRDTMSQRSAELQLQADKGNLAARESKLALDKLNEQLKGADERINSAKIDPARWVNNQSAGRQILNRFAIFLGALGEGLTQGRVKNIALQLFNRAIDQDIASQKANLAKEMQARGMKARDVRRAMIDYNKNQAEKKDALRSLYAIELTKAGLEQRDVDTQAKYNQAALALSEKKADISAKSRDRVTRTSQSTSRKVPVMPKSAMRKLDEPTRRRVVEFSESMDKGIETANRLQKLLVKASKFPNAGKDIPNTLAQDISMTVKDLALFHRKAMGDSGPIRDEDFKTFDRVGAGRATFKPTMLRRLEAFKKSAYQSKARTIKSLFMSDQDIAKQGIEATIKASKIGQSTKAAKKYKAQ